MRLLHGFFGSVQQDILFGRISSHLSILRNHKKPGTVANGAPDCKPGRRYVNEYSETNACNESRERTCCANDQDPQLPAVPTHPLHRFRRQLVERYYRHFQMFFLRVLNLVVRDPFQRLGKHHHRRNTRA